VGERRVDEAPLKFQDGKDELNLAEFPLCALADRLAPGQKTMVFEDRIWDANRGEMVTRRLTITGSDEYGLPTAHDDEVLLGLLQLSRLGGFADRRVNFTRYELIRLLGWREESKSYARIALSLNRWVGVTLYYDHAWWNRAEQCWVDEKFHVLDNVTLFDRDSPRGASRQGTLQFSTFSWNDVLFRSFRAGNLKSLDFEFVQRLDSAIAKRLYRFLDKRFFHRPRYEFNLKELCWEHVGLSRNYDATDLKRKLRPAIIELEQAGFLEPVPDSERFRKVRCGDWRVGFAKAAARRTAAPPDPAQDELATALCARGVTASSARALCAEFPADRIRSQLEVFDWLVAQQDKCLARNPAGYLVSSIRGEYAPPRAFVSQADQAKRAAAAAERARAAEARAQRLAEQEQARLQARTQAVAGFWDALSPAERQRQEAEALAAAQPAENRLLRQGGRIAQTLRQNLLEAYALQCLQAEGA
jgi:hypothetical protein